MRRMLVMLNRFVQLPVLGVFLALSAMILSQPSFDIQGHRGARGLLPENSIPAFLHALKLGVTTLEMDVVIASDSTVVVSHEPWMSEVICSSVPSGEKPNIFALTYDEIARYDCGSRGHPDFPRQQKLRTIKPRLVDVIEAAENYAHTHGLPPVRYNIETKARPAWDDIFTPDPKTFTRLLYNVLAEKDIVSRTIHQSFDIRTLRAGRQIDPSWPTALLIAEQADVATDIRRLGFTPTIYSPHYRLVSDALVRKVHQHEMLLIPWTVNTLSDMQRMKKLNVDGLITDYPDIGVTLQDR